LPRTILKINDYSFFYPNSKTPTFEDVNLEIKEGDFAILTGDTGCGKTTFLKSLLPNEILSGKKTGKVTLLSAEDNTTPLIGYVSQNPENQLICESVWHEIAFALENYGADRSLMRRRVAEISHFFGIESWFHKNVGDLSGGEMQIVNLAKAVVTCPKLLLLDEPTSQLDPISEKNFLHTLFRINRELKISIIIATHSPETVKDYATKAFLLRDKKLDEISLTKFEYTKINDISQQRCLSTHEKKAISLKDVYFKYGNETDYILRGLDLNVSKGEIRSLVGGNGSGKTTILKLIAGIEKAKHGKVLNHLKENQAYLPQNPASLFACDSAEEEMREWQKNCNYSNEDIDNMLYKVGLQNKRSLHPFDLSGGQQQLLALAKLLITNPNLLLLDEPTKGLDPKTKAVMANLIREFATLGGTVIIATHDLSFSLCACDSVTMIFDGEATCTENSSDFFKNNLFYRPTPCEFIETYQRSN
jgi:energy-coupling factor transport system ATP-binding protein